MGTPASPLTIQPDPAQSDILARKLRGNELAAELRRVADRAEFAHYRALVYSCINTILLEAARTPERDRARVLKSLHEFGGGTVADVGAHVKLAPADVSNALGALVAARRVVTVSRSDVVGADATLYFLPDDPCRLDYAPP